MGSLIEVTISMRIRVKLLAALGLLALLSACVADAEAAGRRGRRGGGGISPIAYVSNSSWPPTTWTNAYAVAFDGTGDLMLGSGSMFFSVTSQRTECVMYTQPGFAAAEGLVTKYDSAAKAGFFVEWNTTDLTTAGAPADSGAPTDREKWAAPASSGQVIDCYVFDLSQATQANKIKLYRQEGTETGFTLESATVVANAGNNIRPTTARLSFGGYPDGTKLGTLTIAEAFDFDAPLTSAEVGDLIYDHDSNAATPPRFKHPEGMLARDRLVSVWGFGDDAGDSVSGGSPQIKDRWGANHLDVSGNPTIVSWSP